MHNAVGLLKKIFSKVSLQKMFTILEGESYYILRGFEVCTIIKLFKDVLQAKKIVSLTYILSVLILQP